MRPPAPLGADAAVVKNWFDAVVAAEAPVLDGSLTAERDAAEAYARMAKAENTRRAYRAAVRAWCDWCTNRNLPPLPGAGADVAAFLASERGRGLTPETLKLRRAAIRYLHRAAGCAVPTDDVAVSETLAGICRQAARQGFAPRKKVAATAGILRQILAPIPADLRGLRDRAILLVGFAGALRRSELAAIRVEQLEKTERGLRLTLPQSKGSQTEAVVVPLPYGHTELCPVRALTAWLEAGGITSGPAFRRIWLPKKVRPGGGRQGSASEAGGSPTGGEPPPLPPPAFQRPSPLDPSPAPPRIGTSADHPLGGGADRPGAGHGGRVRRPRFWRAQPQARRAHHRHGSRRAPGQAQAAGSAQELRRARRIPRVR